MLLASFNATFHLGLAAPVLLLVWGRNEGFQFLLWVGMIHILVLYGLGSRLPIPRDDLAVKTLQTAGFLHTLVGLGAAVITVAQSWARAIDGVGTTAALLAPLGTAIVPHIMGVWLAHTIEAKNYRVGTPLEDLRKRLDDLTVETFRILDLLQVPLKNLKQAVVQIAGDCTEVSATTREALRDLEATTASITSTARELQPALDKIVAINAQLTVIHQQLIELLRSLLSPDRVGGGGR